MKMRQHKRIVQSKITYIALRPVLFTFKNDTWVGHKDPNIMALADRMIPAAPDSVEQAKQEFICVKVSDGTVVDTFDLYEDADQLVHKHIRGKKAKLQILDSITGAVVDHP